MPTYSFRNNETKEEFEKFMSMSAREQFLAENPHIETLITTAVPLGDAYRLGITRPDSGFKEVLQKVKEKTNGAHIESRYI